MRFEKLSASTTDGLTATDVVEDIYVKDVIEERIRELDEMGGLSHEEVKQRLAKWLTVDDQ